MVLSILWITARGRMSPHLLGISRLLLLRTSLTLLRPRRVPAPGLDRPRIKRRAQRYSHTVVFYLCSVPLGVRVCISGWALERKVSDQYLALCSAASCSQRTAHKALDLSRRIRSLYYSTKRTCEPSLGSHKAVQAYKEVPPGRHAKDASPGVSDCLYRGGLWWRIVPVQQGSHKHRKSMLCQQGHCGGLQDMQSI